MPPQANAEPAGEPASPPAPPPVDRLAARNTAISDQLATESTARQVQDDLRRKRAEQCKEATARYERSIAARRIYREDKAGQRVYLPEAEAEKARIDARTDRDAACGSQTR
jgi:hypothetical protein